MVGDAASEEHLDFRHDLWWQAACFRAKHAVQTHPAVPLDRAAKRGSIDRNHVVAALIMPPRDHFEKAIPVSARDRSGHPGLGREMVVDTGALDADLGCKIGQFLWTGPSGCTPGRASVGG